MPSSTTNYQPLPGDCFPYAVLPDHYVHKNETPVQALRRILVKLQEAKLYSEGTWQKDSSLVSNEAKTADFFNRASAIKMYWAQLVDDVHCFQIARLASTTPPRNKWRAHEGKMVERHRKPDIILVSDADAKLPQNRFSSILSYCEVKITQDPNHRQNVHNQFSRAREQLMDMAGCVISVQRGRRFLVGLALCNAELVVALFIRGCSVFTTSINIDQDPLTFLNIILTITHASPTWIGLDARFGRKHNTVTLNGRTFYIVCTLFRSLGVGGKGTVVYLCRGKFTLPSGDVEDRYYVLKESWVNANWPSDVEIHNMMKNAGLKPLTDAEEERFGQTDKYKVFQDCVAVPSDASWDYTIDLPGITVMELAEIAHCNNPSHFEIQDERYQDRICEDTTAHILERMNIAPNIFYEPRVHEFVLYRSIGVPIIMFSCRRELVNAMLGIVCALFNGIRKGVLHCDISQNNTMLRVAKLGVEDAIPDWPRHGYVKRAGLLGDWGLALKYSATQSSKNREDGWVTGTFPFIATELVTPTGLKGHIAHKPHHDLESLFWVLWIISINYIGPFGKQRSWVAGNGQVFTSSSVARSSTMLSAIRFGASGRRSASGGSTGFNSGSVATTANSALGSAHTSHCSQRISGATSITTPTISLDGAAAPLHATPAGPYPHLTSGKLIPISRSPTEANPGFNRFAEDDTKCQVAVPVWATPEPHQCTFNDVLAWRMGQMEGTRNLTMPISPYFKKGPGGQQFVDGITELAKRFQWTSDCRDDNGLVPPENPITHQEFFDILLKMRDAIDNSDKPSLEDIARGRESFQNRLRSQTANFEHELKSMSPSDLPNEPQPSSGGSSKRTREEPERGSHADGSKRGRNTNKLHKSARGKSNKISDTEGC